MKAFTSLEQSKKLFPELKESENEKLRKEMLQIAKESEDSFYMVLTPNKRETLIAWLEKQGEQKHSWSEEDEHRVKDAIYFLDTSKKHYASTVEIDACIDWLKFIRQSLNEEKVNNVNKVEPKFKVGDWVVFVNQSICQVEKIENGFYILRHTRGGIFRVCVLHDESLRLWTIKDAKDGDVLSSCHNQPFIYNGNFDDSLVGSYCGMQYSNLGFIVSTYKCRWTDNKDIKPATIEQRDLLFQKMKEAGYEWNKDKKKLIKL